MQLFSNGLVMPRSCYSVVTLQSGIRPVSFVTSFKPGSIYSCIIKILEMIPGGAVGNVSSNVKRAPYNRTVHKSCIGNVSSRPHGPIPMRSGPIRLLIVLFAYMYSLHNPIAADNQGPVASRHWQVVFLQSIKSITCILVYLAITQTKRILTRAKP